MIENAVIAGGENPFEQKPKHNPSLHCSELSGVQAFLRSDVSGILKRKMKRLVL